jgi:uncharacterized OB-fold protein
MTIDYELESDRGNRREKPETPLSPTSAGARVPLVKYLEIEAGEPVLRATVCARCDAVYFGERIACSRCEGRTFTNRSVAREGHVRSFTIIHRGPSSIPTPYISAVVVLTDGVVVKANLVGCPPDTDHVRLGMAVRLTTFVAGTDDNGVSAIAFGFTPLTEESSA